MKNWFEIFKTGTHIDSMGNKVTWTKADLEEIVNNFNDKNPDVPLVIGHPKTNAPAYGWVEALKIAGNKLLAKPKEVAPEFAEWVKAGRYKTRSISLKDNCLRHIGWLGAQPPAIKGLEAYQFAEDEDIAIYEFSDTSDFKFQTVAECLARLREFLIEKYDIETADKVISNWKIEDLRHIDTKTVEEVKAFSEAIMNPLSTEKENILTTTELQQPALKGENEFSEQLAEKDREIEDLRAQLEIQKTEKRKAEFEQFASKLVEDGNITTAQKPLVMDFMEICHQQGDFEFAEGEEKSVLAKFKDLMTSIKQVEFSELASPKTVEVSDTNSIDFSDAEAIAVAIDLKRIEYRNQGVEKSDKEILKELKKVSK